VWYLGRAEINGGLQSFTLSPSSVKQVPGAAGGGASQAVTLIPSVTDYDPPVSDRMFALAELLWFSGNRLTLDVSGIARRLDSHAPTVAPYRFRRDGDFWDICYQGRACKVKDSKGLVYIATLLEQPEREAHVFELNQAANGAQSDMTDPMLSNMSGETLESIGLSVGDLGDAGEVMTPEGKQRLRLAIQQFDDQIADAEEVGLSDEADRLKEQKTLVFEHLASSMGLGGRTRKSASTVEKARKAVTQAIQRSIRSFEKTHPPLNTHLANTITTGTTCIYRPEKLTPWLLE